MIYSLKVTWDDGEQAVELGEKEEEHYIITNAKVMIDTIDNKTLNKSKAINAKIEICGKMEKDIRGKLNEFFDWARDLNSASTSYRKVTLKVREDPETVFRVYEFENVFVVDYVEEYLNSEEGDQGDKGGIFTLKMTQKENNLKTINVLEN